MSWIDQRPDDAMDGAFTAVAPAPAIASVDVAAFRDAMSRLGAAVHGRGYWSQCRELLLMAITYNIMLL